MEILIVLLTAAAVGLVVWLVLRLLPFVDDNVTTVGAILAFIVAILVQLGRLF